MRKTHVQSAVGYARNALSEMAFRGSWTAGREASVDEAIVIALSLGERASGTAEPNEQNQQNEHDVLTRRELEVAGLLARGLSNRRIAEALVISQDTVAVHVKHILAKLGFSSRAQIAAWIARQESVAGTPASGNTQW
jgi:DNA-binding NarL/FixJ family response regulator